MPRIHLVEFEDLSWFPKNIRNYMTDYLQFVANKYDIYEGIVPILSKGLEKCETTTIIDLASGGGGGWNALGPYIKDENPSIRIMLTDLFPNIEAFSELKKNDPLMYQYSEEKVSALDVPAEFKGLRTMFLSFHHFRKIDAQQILQNAVDSKQGIAIFEAQKNSVADFFKLFFSPLNVLAFTPMIKPLTIGRIFFTYFFPLVPIFTWWDGLVSVLRSYSEKEQRILISNLKNNSTFDWEIGEVKKGMFTIYYLLGYPKSR